MNDYMDLDAKVGEYLIKLQVPKDCPTNHVKEACFRYLCHVGKLEEAEYKRLAEESQKSEMEVEEVKSNDE